MADQPQPDRHVISRTGVIVAGVVLIIALGLLGPALIQAREAARQTQLRNVLKTLGLALHNYHDTFDTLPPGGTFDAQGASFHGWTTSIAPYLDASPWYSMVNFDKPWNDVSQVSHFRRPQSSVWNCPWRIAMKTPSGLWLNHFAANQNVMSRNSRVSLQDKGMQGRVILVAEAHGHFLPLGTPYGWRNVRLNLGISEDGFGSTHWAGTDVAHADGSVSRLGMRIDETILAALAGSGPFEPDATGVTIPANLWMQDDR